MEKFLVQILDTKEVKKDKKIYYIIKLYISFSDVVITAFVSQDTYLKICTGEITNDNIKDFLHFSVDSNMVFHVSIY